MLRQKRRSIQDIQDHMKTDFFQINFQSLKDSLDDRIKHCLDTITQSLKESITKDQEIVKTFISFANECLLIEPSSIQDIIAQKDKYIDLEKKKVETAEIIQRINEKNGLLNELNIPEIQMTQLQEAWETFMSENGNFNDKLQQNIEKFKEQVKMQFVVMDSQIQNYYEKWNALKPKDLKELSLEEAKSEYEKLENYKNNWKTI